MKKRILCVLLSFVLVFTVNFAAHANVVMPISQNTMHFATVNFDKEILTPGEITATVLLWHSNSKNDEECFLALGFYDEFNVQKGFAVKKVVVPRNTSNYQGKTEDISINISNISKGDYVKVIALEATRLKPYTYYNSNTLYAPDDFILGVQTGYKGIYERYYTLSAGEGNLDYQGGSFVINSKGSRVFRLKHMGDGKVAFEDYISKMRITNDGGLKMKDYDPYTPAQHFVLEENQNYYAVKSALDGKYLSFKNNTVSLGNEPCYFSLNLVGETPFTLATSLPGYYLLDEAQKQRMEEIYTSVGAGLFYYTNPLEGSTILKRGEELFTYLYKNRANMTAQEQKDAILAEMAKPVFQGTCGGRYEILPLPDGDAEVTLSEPVRTRHVIWDLTENGEPFTGQEIDCYEIKVTYKTETTTQTVNLYCVDPTFENIQNAAIALGKFPYNYRKYIKNLYVYYSTANTFNCGGEELFVRVSFIMDVKSIVDMIAHELGHSVDIASGGNQNDTSTHFCQSAIWQDGVKNDIITVSDYGILNYYEGFAEFSRLYFECYGKQDMEAALKQLFPGQYSAFKVLLDRIGGISMY